jgi:hypothetical protein
MHVKTSPAANLCHVGTPMIAVAAEATPRRSTRAAHARVPTLTPEADDQPDRPYGLGLADNLVGEEGEAVTDGPGVEEPHALLVAGLLEEALAGPERDWVDHQP